MGSDLFFENKKYITAKDASRLTGYSKDYVGQLCRHNKVSAKRIGHTWYVSEESILNYKNTPATFDFTKNFSGKSLLENKVEINKALEVAQPPVLSEEIKRFNPETNLIKENNEILQPAKKIVSSKISLFHPRVSTLRKFVSIAVFILIVSGLISLKNNLNSFALVNDKNVGLALTNNIGLPNLAELTNFSKLNSFASDSVKILSDFYTNEISQKYVAFGNKLFRGLDNSRNLPASVAILESGNISPVDHSGVLVYETVSGWFQRNIYSPIASLFGTQNTTVNNSSIVKTTTSTTTKTIAVSTTTKNSIVPTPIPTPVPSPIALAPKVVNTTNVIERIIERQTPSDFTKEYLEQRLQELNNNILSKLSELSTGSGGTVTNIYQQIATSQRIDKLSNVTITSSSFSGGSISDSSVNATNLSVSGNATSTFTGGIAVNGGCVSVNGTCLGTGSGTGSPGGSDTELQFNDGGTFNGANNFVFINSTGNVGIGTTSPFEKLSVGGNVIANTFIATSTATSTFVGGISTNLLSVTSTIATSTFSNGINLLNGCFSVNGTCVGSGAGTLTSIGSGYSTTTGSNITLSTSTSLFNGLTSSLNIVANGGALTLTPSLSGTLGIVGGGTGLNSISAAGVLLGNYDGTGIMQLSTSSLGLPTFGFPFTSSVGYNSTSTTLGFLNGLFSTASSTFSGTFRLPSLSNGELAVYGGLVGSYATTTAGTGLTYSANAFNVNTTQNITNLSNLTSNGIVYTAGSNGTLNTTGTSTPTIGASLLYTGGTAGFFVGGTGGTLALNLGNANTWTALQSFNYSSSTIYSTFQTSSTTLASVGTLNITGPSQGYAFLGSGGLLSTISTSTLASQVFTATTFAANSILTTNSAGNIIATGSQLTVGTILATSTTASSNFLGKLALSSSTPWAQFSINPNALGSGVPEFAIGSTSGTHFVVDGGGNVGINVANPSYALDIIGSANFVERITGAGNSLLLTGSDPYIKIHGTGTGLPDYQMGVITGSAPEVFAGSITNTPFTFYVNNSKKITLDTSGNFDIATTSGNYILTSYQASAPQLALSNGAGLAQWVFRNAGGNLYLATTTVAGTATTSTSAITINGTTGGISLATSSVGCLKTDATGLMYTGTCAAFTGAANSIVTTDSGGNLIATTSQLTTGSLLATSTVTNSVFLNNWTLFGTTTNPIGALSVFSTSTKQQISLSAGANLAQVVFRNDGTNFYIGTTTVVGSATTSTPSLMIVNSTGYTGLATTSPFGQFSIDTSGNQNNPAFVIGSQSGGTVLSVSTSTQPLFMLGTSSPFAINGTLPSSQTAPGKLVIATTTTAQISLIGELGQNSWNIRGIGGAFYIGTSTNLTQSTTTLPQFGIATSGIMILGDYANCNGTTNALGVSGGLVLCDSLTSDARKKNDIEPLNEGLSMIMKLKPSTFYWKEKEDKRQQVGFVAQDVLPLIPTAVETSPDGFYTLQPDKIIPYLVKSVQELAQTKGLARKAEENWQDVLIGLLIIGFVYQQWQINKLKKK